MNSHILEQFASERITADNYGEVYLGGLQAVLAQSVQFLLTKDRAAFDAALSLTQVKKGIEEVELVKAQLALTEEQTNKVKQDILVSIDQQTLIPLQRDKMIQEILLLKSQVGKIDKENELLDKEILKASEEVLVLRQQVLQSVAQVTKTEKEVELIGQQIANAKEQILKSQAEIKILGQRFQSEVAQTQDGAAGILGAQTALYAAQTKGFADDSIRKGVKAANDVFAIAKSNDGDDVENPVNMRSTLEYFLAVMQAAQESS